MPNHVTYEVLAQALFENYESIYDIDLATNAYHVYHESAAYRSLHLARSGDDFFRDLPAGVERVVDEPDRARVLRALAKDALVAGVRADKYYAITYRIDRDGRKIRHQLRATLVTIDGSEFILFGVRDIDDAAPPPKRVFVQTFGRFLVKKDGRPIALTGKAKEILALVVTRGGKEISNEEIYRTLWEDRPCDNASMGVYYNALARLKRALAKEGLSGLLVSTAHGQTVDVALFDCDWYAWKRAEPDEHSPFEGEFLSEYPWADYLIGELLDGPG